MRSRSKKARPCSSTSTRHISPPLPRPPQHLRPQLLPLPLLPQRAPFFLERVQLLLRLRLLPLQFFGVGKRLFFVH